MSRLIRRDVCPLCKLEGRDTAGDNLAVYDDGHTYCFGGHGLTSGNLKDFNLNFTYEYLPWRNVSKETMAFYDVKTKIDEEGKPISIGFQYPNQNFKIRNLDTKEFYTIKDKPPEGLFGRDKFSAGQSRYVTITEGELDALSLCQALSVGNPLAGSPVVSVQSAVTAGRDCAVDRAWLNSFERIYLAFDADEPGRRARDAVAKLFDPSKVFVVKFTKRKDPNEFLVAGESEGLKRIWWNSRQYLPENILSSFNEFEVVLGAPRKLGVPYPFKFLTDMTYGIRTGETVLITAREKVGKTELMHFIEHQLLKRTNDNVGSFFLEESPQRHLHALAGIELSQPVQLPDSGCSDAEILSAIHRVVGRDERLHLYTHFGSDDPVVFLDTIRFLATARSCRYILVDHISVIISGNSSINDERKQLDYLSTKLEMLAKELDIAIIIVSHVNDEGQTRGSRWLTKMFDITISAERDLMSPDPVERSTLKLSVPYNRYCSRTGPAGHVLFVPETYSFVEVSANDNFPEGIGAASDRRVA